MNKENYVDVMKYLEKLNRFFLDNIKSGLENSGISDVSAVQAMMLYSLKTDKVSMTDLHKRGHYLGTNAAYNVSNLLKNNYLVKDINTFDLRGVWLSLSEKGLKILDLIDSVITLQSEALTSVGINDKNIDDANNILDKITRVLEEIRIKR